MLPVALAFLAVKAVQVYLYPHPYLVSDSDSYLQSALSLQVNPYRPIGYSLFLAATKLLRASPIVTVLLQSAVRLVALSLLCLVLARHARFPRWAVTTTALVLAFDPFALFMDHHVMSDSLFLSCTVAYLAALLAFLARRSNRWYALAGAFALAAMLVRFVGVLYPVFLVCTAGFPRRAGFARAALLSLSTAAALFVMSAWTAASLGVFRPTTFDGWALYGNIGPLLGRVDRTKLRTNDDAVRLFVDYLGSFPEGTWAGHATQSLDTDWHRWHRDSASKHLLGIFSGRAAADSAEWVRNATFIASFQSLVGRSRSPAVAYFARNRSETGEAPYELPYDRGFTLVNMILEGFDRSFLAAHRGAYVTGFYLPSFRGVFFPTNVVTNEGRYSFREHRDRAVEAFWPDQDSRTWKPRFADVAAGFRPVYRWIVPVEWLAALVLLGRWLPGWRRLGCRQGLVGPGLLACAVVFGAAVSWTHYMENRYTLPIRAFVVVAAMILAIEARRSRRSSTSPSLGGREAAMGPVSALS